MTITERAIGDATLAIATATMITIMATMTGTEATVAIMIVAATVIATDTRRMI